ncbi:MAG TPA: hypothetical protein VLE94_03435 [Burkholderiaceae bacterium]|nr:hypothetical protein [Burkholderiaceae bacterium]
MQDALGHRRGLAHFSRRSERFAGGCFAQLGGRGRRLGAGLLAASAAAAAAPPTLAFALGGFG